MLEKNEEKQGRYIIPITALLPLKVGPAVTFNSALTNWPGENWAIFTSHQMAGNEKSLNCS